MGLKSVVNPSLFLSPPPPPRDSSVPQLTDTVPGSVVLLSRGTFSCPANLLPWRSSSSGIYKKSHRRAPSSESVPGLERLLKSWSLAELPQGPASTSGPQGPLDPYEPLLPLLMGPCMGLWRECYLRGALHAQVGTTNNTKHHHTSWGFDLSDHLTVLLFLLRRSPTPSPPTTPTPWSDWPGRCSCSKTNWHKSPPTPRRRTRPSSQPSAGGPTPT